MSDVVKKMPALALHVLICATALVFPMAIYEVSGLPSWTMPWLAAPFLLCLGWRFPELGYNWFSVLIITTVGTALFFLRARFFPDLHRGFVGFPFMLAVLFLSRIGASRWSTSRTQPEAALKQ